MKFDDLGFSIFFFLDIVFENINGVILSPGKDIQDRHNERYNNSEKVRINSVYQKP